MSWRNDGLQKKFGTEKTTVQPLGEYRTSAAKRQLELKFDFTQMPTVAAGLTIISDLNALPVGCTIESVEIYSSVDFTSTSSDLTLSVGTIDQDHTSNGTANSLVDAATLTELNTGGSNIAGWVGSAINATAFTTSKLITWTVANHAALTGKGAIRINYSVI